MFLNSIKKYTALVALTSMLSFAVVNAASSWPASSSGTNIGSGIAALYPTFEASGIAWHAGRNQMIVVGDEGQVIAMDKDGTNATLWSFSGKDLEAVAVDPNTTEYVYLADEDGYIYKFSFSSGTIVQTWDVRTYIPEVNGKLGMESLTYVNGYFYGGSQYDGKITVFDLSGTTATVVQTLNYGFSTMQDLYYSSETEVLYVLGSGLLREVKNGAVSAEYSLVGSSQEGVTLLSGCPASSTTVYITEDLGGAGVNVKTYGGYPISCSSLIPTTSSSDWPASSTATDLGAGIAALYPTFEASGLVWNAGASKFVVMGDNGQVAVTDASGNADGVWTVGGDLEGVTYAGDAEYVYLGDENGYVYKFSMSSHSIVQTWDVRSLITITSGKGMEGLTYANGYFYAGSQSDGQISVLDLSASVATLVETLDYNLGTLSDVFYSIEEDALYIVANGYLYTVKDGAVTLTYAMPGSIQEGVTFVSGCPASTNTIYVTEDHGETGGVYFKSYASFPVNCETVEPVVVDPDSDGDGVVASLDCDDADATVSSYTTFYKDNDKDTYGYEAASLCMASAPSGYVTNNLDFDDTKGIEIYGDKKDNDGDGTVDEVNYVSTNGYHPYYSRLDPSQSYSGYIKSYSGLNYGDYLVKYADNSTYRYSAFDINSKTRSTVSPQSGTAYFKITSGSYTKIINAYTGL